MNKKLDLKDIVLIGRTFNEYYKMFDLGNIVPEKENILDVASGVSSFSATANTKGYHVIASDCIYCFKPEEIKNKCEEDINNVMLKMHDIQELYKWEYFSNINELIDQRRLAYHLFLNDFKKNRESTYYYTEYPNSLFDDKQFSISLVSHFLFMYDEILGYDFHKNTIMELIRVTQKEIRIFPLVNLSSKKSKFVKRLMEDDTFDHCEMSIRKVDYEFVKNGNEMLVIKF